MCTKNKIKKGIFLLNIVVILSNCAPENDLTIPDLVVAEQEIDGTILPIDAVLGMLGQALEKEGENAKVIFEDTDTYVLGYVISDDKAGNFFKELILQDKNINPSAGMRILVNKSPLFTSYEFGRKIVIKLNGLSLGIQNGVPTLGVSEGNDIGEIPSFSIDNSIIRLPEVATITPLELDFEDFTDDFLHLYIRVSDIQFNKNIISEPSTFTFAAEPNDGFDGERILESCKTGRTTVLSTSTFSDFKGLSLPPQQGSFEGILTKNFLGDMYNLVLNDPTGLIFDNESRCDPVVLQCDASHTATTVVFEEDFTALKIKDLETKGWINSNTTRGKLTYKIGDFAENQYALITGFRSKEPIYEVWLITPEIELTAYTNTLLDFDLQAGYDNGNILEVFVTENYTDDIATTSWIKLDAAIPKGPLNSFGAFIAAGPIGLSCLDGSVRIGFRYIGGDPRATTRYHIDTISIKGTPN